MSAFQQDLLQSQDEELQNLKKRLSIVEQNARDWENRYRTLKRSAPPPEALTIILSISSTVDLTREATIRKIRPEAFARLLLEQVVKDKLFVAILDQ